MAVCLTGTWGYPYLAPTAPDGHRAQPPNFHFPLTNQCSPPMLQGKGIGAWLELCCPRVQEEERKQQQATVFREGARTLQNPNSSPRPSREPSGTEINGLIRLLKWIIVFLSIHRDSARLTKGPGGQAWGLWLHLIVTCAM